jgi:hypothetical protein
MTDKTGSKREIGDMRRRYRVIGVDGEGDVHIFETDDRPRAAAMKDVFAEGLGDVGMLEDIDIADGTEPPEEFDRRLRSEPFAPE